MSSAPPTADFLAGRDSSPRLGPGRVRRVWRVFIFYSSAVLLTGSVSWLFADLIWRTGWSLSGVVLLCLFTVLFLLIAVGCMHGVFGFVLRLTGDRRITNLKDYRGQSIQGAISGLRWPYPERLARVPVARKNAAGDAV